eukprot:4198714-Prymnesium_polylepis.1
MAWRLSSEACLPASRRACGRREQIRGWCGVGEGIHTGQQKCGRVVPALQLAPQLDFVQHALAQFFLGGLHPHE